MSKDDITIQSPITEEKILGSNITEEKVISSGITTNLVIQSPIGEESEDAPPIPAVGLVMEQLFEGGSLLDTSDNSYNGTAFNSPTPVAGINGVANSAYFLDGVDQFIDFGVIAELEGTTEFSFSFWVKKALGDVMNIGKNHDIAGIDPGAVWQWSSNDIMFMFVNNGTVGFDQTTTIIDFFDIWLHMVVVYNGALSNNDRIKFWHNAVPLSTSTGSTIATITDSAGESFKIGKQQGANFARGSYDNIRVYNKAIIQSEIDILYAEKT